MRFYFFDRYFVNSKIFDEIFLDVKASFGINFLNINTLYFFRDWTDHHFFFLRKVDLKN